MARKITKTVILRYYEGEEGLVQAIEALDNSVVINEHLKTLIHQSLMDGEENTANTPVVQPAAVDAEALSKELLPQIRKVVEAAVSSILTEHTISPANGEKELDETAQQRIQDGLKQLGQSMM